MMTEDNVLIHHGIKGQKWGVRRFQNEDGSLTNAGKKRYSFKERLDISSEYTKEQNRLRTKYLDESAEFKKYSKLAADFEDECLNKYGFRPGEDGQIWEIYDDDGYEVEYDREPKTRIEKEAVDRYLEFSDKACEAAKIPNQRAQSEAKKYIEDKYGDRVLSQITRDNNAIVGAAVVASLAMTALPFVLVGAGVHGLKKLVK